MNRAFLVVGVPAVITSFCWLAFGWGWRVAVGVTTGEILAITGLVIYVLRRQNRTATNEQARR
jgi:membrane protein implicated in regulation of membrane protease activity